MARRRRLGKRSTRHQPTFTGTPEYNGLPDFIRLAGTTVTIESSDGCSSRVPPPEPCVVDSDGEIDFEEEADSHSDAVKGWKKKIATLLVRVLGTLCGAQDAEEFTYILSDFPANYKLYLRLSGDKSKLRRDFYLYGSEHVARFASPEEFVLHAMWLVYGKPMDENGRRCCGCKYCSLNKQRDITRYLVGEAGDIVREERALERRPRATTTSEVYQKDYSHGGALQIVTQSATSE